MNGILDGVWERMRDIGLAALAHANTHAAYYDKNNPRWAELSILQAAHAAEIIFKARIAQEHPLLIFEKLPELKEETQIVTQEQMLDGITIIWSKIPNTLKATTGITMPNLSNFKEFGKIRNGVQHFGILKNPEKASDDTLGFIFSVVDPFIKECWGLYAVDYNEDPKKYRSFPSLLIERGIDFNVSPKLIEYRDNWGVEERKLYGLFPQRLGEYINNH